jgi:hypothetical protein
LTIISRGFYDYRFLTVVCPIEEGGVGARTGVTVGIVGKGNVADELLPKEF